MEAERQVSKLSEGLDSGRFLVTCELNPPKGTGLQPLFDKAEMLGGDVDAFNVTDSASSVMAMAPIAAAHMLVDRGLCPDPVGYGYNLVPWSRFDSLIISRHLSGVVTARQQLESLKEKADRDRIIEASARDLAVMLKNNLFQRDAHFGNILLDPACMDELYWIDNDLQQISSKDRERAINLLMRRIATKRHASQKLILQKEEVEWMHQVITRHLATI